MADDKRRKMNMIKDVFVGAILAMTVATSATSAGTPSDKKLDPEYFARLPVPDADPSKWQWASSVSQTTIKMLDKEGQANHHYPRIVMPQNDAYPSDMSRGKVPGVGRGHGGMTYVNWTLGLRKLVDLSVDITFHSDPLPSACLLYTSPSPRDRTRSRMPSSA